MMYYDQIAHAGNRKEQSIVTPVRVYYVKVTMPQLELCMNFTDVCGRLSKMSSQSHDDLISAS